MGEGMVTVAFRVNTAVWHRIAAEAARTGASVGVVVAAAMDTYDAAEKEDCDGL